MKTFRHLHKHSYFPSPFAYVFFFIIYSCFVREEPHYFTRQNSEPFKNAEQDFSTQMFP